MSRLSGERLLRSFLAVRVAVSFVLRLLRLREVDRLRLRDLLRERRRRSSLLRYDFLRRSLERERERFLEWERLRRSRERERLRWRDLERLRRSRLRLRLFLEGDRFEWDRFREEWLRERLRDLLRDLDRLERDFERFLEEYDLERRSLERDLVRERSRLELLVSLLLSIPMTGSIAAEIMLWASFTIDIASSISFWAASLLFASGFTIGCVEWCTLSRYPRNSEPCIFSAAMILFCSQNSNSA